MSDGYKKESFVDRYENIRIQIFENYDSFFNRNNFPIDMESNLVEMRIRFAEEQLTLRGLASEIDESLEKKSSHLANESMKIIEEPFMNYISEQFIPSAISIILEAKDVFKGPTSEIPEEVFELEKLQENIRKSRDKGNLPSLN